MQSTLNEGCNVVVPNGVAGMNGSDHAVGEDGALNLRRGKRAEPAEERVRKDKQLDKQPINMEATTNTYLQTVLVLVPAVK